MKTSEFLRQAKAVIDTPEKWTKHFLARKFPDQMRGVYPSDPQATCFCALGATEKARWDAQPSMPIADGTELLERAQARLVAEVKRTYPTRDVADFNDHTDTTHEMIMQLFDDAITTAEAEGD